VAPSGECLRGDGPGLPDWTVNNFSAVCTWLLTPLVLNLVVVAVLRDRLFNPCKVEWYALTIINEDYYVIMLPSASLCSALASILMQR